MIESKTDFFFSLDEPRGFLRECKFLFFRLYLIASLTILGFVHRFLYSADNYYSEVTWAYYSVIGDYFSILHALLT